MNMKQMRFYAVKKDGVLILNGGITDTTSFQNLDGLVEKGDTIDLSKLEFGTWIGMNSLYGYLEQNIENFEFINIPEDIFSIFKQIDGIRELDLKTFSVKTIDLSTMEQGITVMDGNALEKLFKDQGEFPKLENNLAFASPIHLLTPKLFCNSASESWHFKHGWFKKNSEETEFWCRYLHFVLATISGSVNLISSADHNITGLLSRVSLKVENGQKALNILRNNKVEDFNTAMAIVVDAASKYCDVLLVELCGFGDKIEKSLLSFQASIFDPNKITPVYESLKSLCSEVESLTIMEGILENTGTSIGELVMNMRAVQEIKSAIVSCHKLDPERLKDIREAFVLMNPLSEDDWSETKAEILDEIKDLENCLGQCVVTLQTFDLVRQILDHRVIESRIILGELPNLISGSNCNWLDVKEKIVSHIAKTKVTDQEKLGFRFFLRAEFDALADSESETSQPGDMLMF